MSTYLLKANFVRGELSPRLHGRMDIEQYGMGLVRCLNWVVMRQGGLRRRPGTVFAGEVKDSSKATRLLPFEFNETQAYVIEMGENYFRWFALDGQVYNGGSPYEVAHTYAQEELFRVQFAQSADVLYFANSSYVPRKLTRVGEINWTVTDHVPTSSPWTSATSSKWPAAVGFFENRLVWANSQEGPRGAWFSASANYDSHAVSSPAVDSDALEVSMSGGKINQIQWIADGDDLIVGTTQTVRSIGALASADAFSASNIKQRIQSTVGSSHVQPVVIGTTTIYTNYQRRRLQEFTYSFELNGYTSDEISIMAGHIFRKGINALVYQSEPENLLFAPLDTGEMAAITLEKTHSVTGVAEIQIAGGSVDDFGVVESAASIPVTSGERLWMVVKRTINGQTKRFVEYFADDFEDGDLEDANFLDCASKYDGVATNTVSGLDYLEGETVGIFVDGVDIGDATVSAGTITLPGGVTGSKITVGLRYKSRAKTLRVATSGGQDGAAMGRKVKVDEIIVDMLETGDLMAGVEGHLYPMVHRPNTDNLNSKQSLFTGTKKLPGAGGWQDDGQVVLETDRALPATIRAVSLGVTGEP